jgi:hypothetical protein
MSLLFLRSMYVEMICMEHRQLVLKFLALMKRSEDILFILKNPNVQKKLEIETSMFIVFVDLDNFHESLTDTTNNITKRLNSIIKIVSTNLDEIIQLLINRY